MTWQAGYVSDIEYTSGFYRELAPSFINFALQSNGFRSPKLNPGTRYLELACGQGLGTMLLAAANPNVEFWGLDFNPAQIANARRLAEAAGLKNVFFDDQSFEETLLGQHGEVPQFDYITLHGIYSWVSAENRNYIVSILDKHLRPGGVVYVSYNSMPGWCALAPLQRLIKEHANRSPNRSDLQAMQAIQFATELKNGRAFYFERNPQVGSRLEKLPDMNRNYLAHEYLNGYWHPLYHLDVVKELDRARLNYGCSASLIENIDGLSLPEEIRPIVANTIDRGWAETIRDYATSKQFRRDLFLRGATRYPTNEMARSLSDLKFCMCVRPSAVSLKFATLVGEVAGHEEIYRPIVDALAEKNMSLFELTKVPALANVSANNILQAITLLTQANYVHPVTDENRKNGEAARRLNKAICDRLLLGEELNFLAAPVIGSAIGAMFVEVLILNTLLSNPKAAGKELVQGIWSGMEISGKRLLLEGKALMTFAEAEPEIVKHVDAFDNGKRAIWQRLGIL